MDTFCKRKNLAQESQKNAVATDSNYLLTKLTMEVFMLQTISQQTKSGSSKWLRVGITSLALGLGALFMSAGSAFASPITFTYTDTLNYEDMDVIDLNGGNNTNGREDQHYGVFDLTSIDFSSHTISEFSLEAKVFQVNPNGGLKTDNLHLGSAWDGSVLTDDMYIADLFDPSGKSNFGQPIPVVGDVFTLDVLLFLNSSQITSKINGGDFGKIAFRLADDFSPRYVKLTLTTVENPEPASLLLMGTGMIGLAAWRIRKRTQA